jgi:hypothetical protein
MLKWVFHLYFDNILMGITFDETTPVFFNRATDSAEREYRNNYFSQIVNCCILAPPNTEYHNKLETNEPTGGVCNYGMCVCVNMYVCT